MSNDPRFEEKLRDIVGLYMNPPENALVLSADEKTSIQALDRTQPSLPLVKGRCGTMTHDYKRNGTTTLFAAMELAHGEVIATCMQRHRHQEWIKFLAMIDEQTPRELNLHVIVDNYATHKHKKVKRWLKQHPRFHMHFIPTSSSWLNIVEGFFRNLDANRLKRSAFRSSSTRSWATSKATTTTPGRSSGRRPPTRSSRRSAAHARNSIRLEQRESHH